MYKIYKSHKTHKQSPTKKLWKKIDKTIPGFSSFIDPIQVLGLNKKQEKYLNLVSGIFLTVDKASKGKIPRRKQFSNITKLKVLRNQNHCCYDCGNRLETVDFNHIDGNRSNNHITNCQALCPNCHAKRTRMK